MVYQDDMDLRLSTLECPFSWDMRQYEAHEDEYDFENFGTFVPTSKFMRFLMLSYNKTLKHDFVEAEAKLKLAEDVISEMEDNCITDVAKHILESTKCFVQIRMGNLDEAIEILQQVINIKDEIYASALNELKCCAWMTCSKIAIANDKVIHFAKHALMSSENANCHFLLAKYLRRKRRLSDFSSSGEEEIHHFQKAFDISKNPQYGLYYAQMLRECGREEAALNIYKAINFMNVKSSSLQLRLALGFIKLHQYDLAKKCLDFVESNKPNDSTFLHYKGIYFMKKKNFEEAIKYFYEAKEQKAGNYAAHMSYVNCMRKLGKRFDFPAYFLDLLENFPFDTSFERQKILLHAAFAYYWIRKDIREAVKYFLRALEIKETDYIFEKYREPLSERIVNVYKVLTEDLLPKIKIYQERKIINLPEETIKASTKLAEICQK